MNMTLDQAITRLYTKYSRYGITKKLLRGLFRDGIENQGFELQDVFDLLRMTLGKEYGEEELFTVEQAARLTGQTQAEIMDTAIHADDPTASGFKIILPNGVNNL